MAGDSRRSDIVFAFFVALLIVAAWHVRQVLLIIYISALFAVVAGPSIELVRKIHIGRWHPGRGIAVLLIFVFGIAAIGLFLTFALPPIFRDLQDFARDLPAKGQRLYARLQGFPFAQHLDVASLQGRATQALGGALGLLTGIAGSIVGFFSWLILTAYFILDGERAFRWGLSLFPAAQRPRLNETLCRAERRVSKWLLGQAMLMLILGSLATVVFGFMRVKYFYALGVFCGLANIVPIVGPLISVSLAALVAAFDSWSKALGVVAFYVIYQQLENAYLTPRIMKSTVDLPALAVIIALTLGGALAGILGALVAVPTAALLAVLIDEYVVKANEG